jgi:hypothetical protein
MISIISICVFVVLFSVGFLPQASGADDANQRINELRKQIEVLTKQAQEY